MSRAAQFSEANTVLFDLDNTLFDHNNSLIQGLSAVKIRFPSYFSRFDLNHIRSAYNHALEEAYQKYLKGDITYDLKDILKVRIFFKSLGLPEPDDIGVHAFRQAYDTAYMSSRRATSGTIEALTYLKDQGYTLGILTNGQKHEQTAKADAIGIGRLVDEVLTSEELGSAKPSPTIYEKMLEHLRRRPYEVVMVGDSIESDIKGALKVGIIPVLYDPKESHKQIFVDQQLVWVINKMTQLLKHL